MGSAASQATTAVMQRAVRLLKGLGAASPSTRLGEVPSHAAHLFAVLDSMLGVLPDSATDAALGELDRVVELLHMVDKEWPGCGDAEAVRLLDLAAQRLERLAKQFGGG